VRNCACVDQPMSGVASRGRNQHHEYQSSTSFSPGLATPVVASSLGLAYDRVMITGPDAPVICSSDEPVTPVKMFIKLAYWWKNYIT